MEIRGKGNTPYRWFLFDSPVKWLANAERRSSLHLVQRLVKVIWLFNWMRFADGNIFARANRARNAITESQTFHGPAQPNSAQKYFILPLSRLIY